MGKRKSAKRVVPRTREEMEWLVGEIRSMRIFVNRHTAEMNEELQAVTQAYAPQIAEQEVLIAASEKAAEAWCRKNPDALGDRRSIEMQHGVVGFRTGNPTLETRGKTTWKTVLANLFISRMNRYIRQKPEVAKDLILADRASIGVDGLAALGLRVAQREAFYCEPKLDEVAAEKVEG